jgi:hypothetical protein
MGTYRAVGPFGGVRHAWSRHCAAMHEQPPYPRWSTCLIRIQPVWPNVFCAPQMQRETSQISILKIGFSQICPWTRTIQYLRNVLRKLFATLWRATSSLRWQRPAVNYFSSYRSRQGPYGHGGFSPLYQHLLCDNWLVVKRANMQIIVTKSLTLNTSITITYVDVCGQLVATYAVIWNLGFCYINGDLLMAGRSGCHHLHQMISIRDTLAIVTAKCIVHAHVTLRIDNVVLYGMSGYSFG